MPWQVLRSPILAPGSQSRDRTPPPILPVVCSWDPGAPGGVQGGKNAGPAVVNLSLHPCGVAQATSHISVAPGLLR